MIKVQLLSEQIILFLNSFFKFVTNGGLRVLQGENGQTRQGASLMEFIVETAESQNQNALYDNPETTLTLRMLARIFWCVRGTFLGGKRSKSTKSMAARRSAKRRS